MDKKSQIAIALCVVAVVAVAIIVLQRYHVFNHEEEDFTAGLSTTTGLSFYNKQRVCYPGNAAGSSDAFCETPGYVLF